MRGAPASSPVEGGPPGAGRRLWPRPLQGAQPAQDGQPPQLLHIPPECSRGGQPGQQDLSDHRGECPRGGDTLPRAQGPW